MCGRYTLAVPDPARLRGRFGIAETVEVRRRFNVAPGDDVLAVTTDRDGAPRGELLGWGLVPSWAETPVTGLKMINARVETVSRRPAFRLPFERFRCLIIADGFYEWAASPGRPKQAYHITKAGGEPFAFAGLWSVWKGGGEEQLRTCTILTRPANDAVAPLHDRMPVILERQAESAWLDRQTDRGTLFDLLSGLTAEATELRAVGPAVNDARYDGPDCLAPAGPELQQTLL